MLLSRNLSFFSISKVRRWPLRFTVFPYTTLFRSGTIDRTADSADVPYNRGGFQRVLDRRIRALQPVPDRAVERGFFDRSEEHTSELQSRGHLVCRLLLEKKNAFVAAYQSVTPLKR